MDLRIFASHVQRDPASEFGRELHGNVWPIEAQLLAEAVDTLALANWQRGGRRHAPRPKPIPRPWNKPKGTQLGKAPIPIADFNTWWDKPRNRA